MSNTQEGTATAVEVKEIKVSEVKALLDQGLDRKEIAAHFGKSVAEMARTVWSSPKLKNLKKKAAPTVVLVDDEDAVEETVVETITETAVEEVEETASNGTEEASASNSAQWQ